MFLFFNCYQIPQRNCKFKRLAGEIHDNNIREKFYLTNTCKCM